MLIEDTERIALAGGEPARELVVALLAEVAVLRERVEEHERLLKRDSTNSSLPPSRDPPLTRQQRRALARERAKASLRKQGGQPGHEGTTREMAPPERVDERSDHLPDACGCGHRFDGGEERLGDPAVHQKWELRDFPTVLERRVEGGRRGSRSDHAGRRAYRHGEPVVAFDATDRPVDASMDVDGDTLVVNVDHRGAVRRRRRKVGL